jgi:hypothetical protein
MYVYVHILYVGETLSKKFEEKYLGIADQVQQEEEEATARLLPR